MGLPALVSSENPGSFGPYELVEQLGQGGMAVVYRARQRGAAGFSREVVLKAMLPALVKSASLVEMFETEARLTAQLRHPNIVQVEDYGVAGDIPYLIMELLDGKNLSQLRNALNKQRRRVPIGAAVTIARDLCLALGYAHHFVDHEGKRMQVIHRDISPSNVMVLRDGSIRLLDFGVAKLSVESGQAVTTSLKGKFAYMAPEQVNQEPIDRRCDVFAAGIVLHELLTGKRLFGTKSELETLRRVSAAEAQPPSRLNPEVPPALDAIVMKALSRRREDRYDSGTEMAAALEGLRLSLGRRQIAGLIEEIFPSVGVDSHPYVDPAELEDTENGDLDAEPLDGVTSPDKVHSAPHLVLVSSEVPTLDESISRTGRDVEMDALSSGSFDTPSVRAAAVAKVAPTESDKAFPSEPTRAAPIEEVRPTRIYDPSKAPERSGSIEEPARPRAGEFDAQPTSVYVSDELLQTPPHARKPTPGRGLDQSVTPPGVVVSPSLSVSLDPPAARSAGKMLTSSVLVEEREQSAPPPLEPQPTRVAPGAVGDAFMPPAYDGNLVPTSGPLAQPRKRRRGAWIAAGGLLCAIGLAGVIVGHGEKRAAVQVESTPTVAAPQATELAAPTPPEPRLPALPQPLPAEDGVSLVDLDRQPSAPPKPKLVPKATRAAAADEAPVGPARTQNSKRSASSSAQSSAPDEPSHASEKRMTKSAKPSTKTVKEGRIVDPFDDGG